MYSLRLARKSGRDSALARTGHDDAARRSEDESATGNEFRYVELRDAHARPPRRALRRPVVPPLDPRVAPRPLDALALDRARLALGVTARHDRPPERLRGLRAYHRA